MVAQSEASGGFKRVMVLAFCVAGIWSAYITQGVLQETLSTKRFGPEAKRFEHLAFLNFAQNVVCLIWSYIMMKLWSKSSVGSAPLWKYCGVSITNTIGPTMGIEALKYISYPAQLVRSNRRKSMPSQSDDESHQLSLMQKHMANILSLLSDALEGVETRHLLKGFRNQTFVERLWFKRTVKRANISGVSTLVKRYILSLMK